MQLCTYLPAFQGTIRKNSLTPIQSLYKCYTCKTEYTLDELYYTIPVT